MLFVSETKLDATFLSNQFQIESYKDFRMDRNCYGESVCLYKRKSNHNIDF